jgi:MYXO-CTERM domain-containing protein
VMGCSSAPGRNRCPLPLLCVDEQPPARPGRCVVPPGCAGNGECPPLRPICDLSVVPRSCVQCLADSQCAAPLVCDQMGSKLCVECTGAKVGNCQAALSGSRCLPSNICGCQVDGDCGPPTSGRVCDGSISRCVIGCRGAGGNGCPGSLLCSSTTMAIGQCGAPPDGGADAGRDAARDTPVPPTDALTRDAPADLRAADAAVDARAADAATVPRDSGAPTDLRAGNRGFLGGGGCGCATPGSGGARRPGTGAALALIGLALIARRRRRSG